MRSEVKIIVDGNMKIVFGAYVRGKFIGLPETKTVMTTIPWCTFHPVHYSSDNAYFST